MTRLEGDDIHVLALEFAHRSQGQALSRRVENKFRAFETLAPSAAHSQNIALGAAIDIAIDIHIATHIAIDAAIDIAIDRGID